MRGIEQTECHKQSEALFELVPSKTLMQPGRGIVIWSLSLGPRMFKGGRRRLVRTRGETLPRSIAETAGNPLRKIISLCPAQGRIQGAALQAFSRAVPRFR